MKPSAHSPETLVISPVTAVTRDAAFAFHRANLGDFMLPLAPSAFQQIVEERQMVAVERGGEIAGLCYLKPDGKELDAVARWEFGGLCLAPALRGQGVGAVLGTVAIAAVTQARRKPVMGYVHQDNHEGMGLLVHRLGFVATGQTVRIGPEDAPGHLRRDSAGFATAAVLGLPDAAMARVADDLEHLGDSSRGHSTPASPRLADGLFPSGLHEVARRLRTSADAAAATRQRGAEPGATARRLISSAGALDSGPQDASGGPPSCTQGATPPNNAGRSSTRRLWSQGLTGHQG